MLSLGLLLFLYGLIIEGKLNGDRKGGVGAGLEKEVEAFE